MWARVDYIKREGYHRTAAITIFQGLDDEVGSLEIPVIELEILSRIEGDIGEGDYLAFSVRDGFSRYKGNIIHDQYCGDPEERHQRCALCKKSLRSRGKYRWSLYFGEHSGDAYHRGCLKKTLA